MNQATDSDENKTINAYCVFCRTGSEHLAVRDINQSYENLLAIVPLKKLPEKRQGQWTTRDLILLPGYIFLFTEGELPFDLRRKTNHLYKILQYERGIRALTGSDAEYASWIYRHQGQITTSHVLLVGESIQVIDGPLLDCHGKIVKLDRHKRRAWVEFEFDGQKRIVSIGAECLNTPSKYS